MATSDEMMAGHVIVAAGKLERMLKEAGATAPGIHDSVSEIEDILSDECVKKLRYIASVRNKLAHGEALSEPLDMAAFDAACSEAALELKRFAGKKGRKPNFAQENMVDEFDREFRLSVRKRLRICGMIPGINTVYFCALSVRAFYNAVVPLTLLTFSLIALPVLIESCRTRNNLYLFIGGMFFVLYWVLTVIYGVRQRSENPEISKFWYILPIISILYLFRMIGRTAEWGGFFCGIIPLCGYAAALTVYKYGYINAALGIVAAIYLAGVIMVGLRRNYAF